MDVSSPRITSAGPFPGHGAGNAGSSPQTYGEGTVDGEMEEDCKGMEYNTDLAEDLYYYILEAPQP